jgi:hypothetical protein
MRYRASGSSTVLGREDSHGLYRDGEAVHPHSRHALNDCVRTSTIANDLSTLLYPTAGQRVGVCKLSKPCSF